MIVPKLAQKLKNLPSNPGVYLFKNAAGEIVYVGKAKQLKHRVRSYFTSSHDLQPRTQQLIANIADLEYILCDTEVESLMLENNLIKKHQPRYNILLRDDKNYQFIKIDYSTQIPTIYTTRQIDEKRAYSVQRTALSLKSKNSNATPERCPLSATPSRYFGPYTSGLAVRQTLRLLRYIFPYCTEKKIGKRPCFYYHLGRCPGVCAGIVSLEEYQKTLARIERFLRGDLKKTLLELKAEMQQAAGQQLYEKAARLRDQIRALETMLQRQKIVSPAGETHDVIAFFQAGSLAAVTLFQVRAGKLVGSENFLLTNTKGATREEILQIFLEKYYAEASDLPPEINLSFPPAESDTIQKLASVRRGTMVHLTWPSRGRKRGLIKMAELNAREYLEKTSQNLAKEQAMLTRALFELKEKLLLPELPLRIEAYDISNIQGTNPTGSMVVFENGKAKKSDYKRFAIRSSPTPDDFRMMRELLERRLSHVTDPTSFVRRSPSVSGGRDEGEWRLPDLFVIDGGKGQLGVAIDVLKSKKLKIPVIGLAKRLEEIFTPAVKTSIRLPSDSPALHLLQRLRDEAHRFAITYHRKKRSRELLES